MKREMTLRDYLRGYAEISYEQGFMEEYDEFKDAYLEDGYPEAKLSRAYEIYQDFYEDILDEEEEDEFYESKKYNKKAIRESEKSIDYAKIIEDKASEQNLECKIVEEDEDYIAFNLLEGRRDLAYIAIYKEAAKENSFHKAYKVEMLNPFKYLMPTRFSYIDIKQFEKSLDILKNFKEEKYEKADLVGSNIVTAIGEASGFLEK